MKRTAPLIIVAALILIAGGLFIRHRDPSIPYTDDREAWTHYEKGQELLQAFRFDDAERELREAVSADTSLAPAHAALGELYGQMGLGERSLHHFAIADSLTAAIAEDRGRLLLQVRLANQKGSRFSADRDSLIDLAREEAPEELTVLVAQALRYDQGGDLAAAERTWRRILEIDPNYAAAYNFLGYLYRAEGRYEEAEEAMRRYAFVAPELANPHDSLGDVLLTVGRYEEAEREYLTALEKQPDFYASLINLSRVYFMRGEIDRALSLVGQVREELAGTRHAEILAFETVDRLFAMRVYDEELEWARQFLAEYPESPYRGSVRIRARLSEGDLATAVALIDSTAAVVRAEPWYGENVYSTQRADASIQRYLGLAAEMAGDHEQAVQRFRDALAQQRDWPPHSRSFDRVHLAYNLIPLGGFDQARVLVRDVLSINPRLAEGVLVAASIEAAAGNRDESRRLLDSLERMLERADDDLPALRDARSLRADLPDPDRI
jgi:tetratricopeptide (TPR) repeat protein